MILSIPVSSTAAPLYSSQLPSRASTPLNPVPNSRAVIMQLILSLPACCPVLHLLPPVSRAATPFYPGQQLSHRVTAPLSSSQPRSHRVAAPLSHSKQRSRAATPLFFGQQHGYAATTLNPGHVPLAQPVPNSFSARSAVMQLPPSIRAFIIQHSPAGPEAPT